MLRLHAINTSLLESAQFHWMSIMQEKYYAAGLCGGLAENVLLNCEPMNEGREELFLTI